MRITHFGLGGKAQAARYLGELEDCCRRLADNPGLGRLCEEIGPGLRRWECEEHVVFYRKRGEGISVSRVLHRQMLPEIHSIHD